jgi:hypothetical protein
MTEDVMDVVQAVKDGKAQFEWAEVVSHLDGRDLVISVFRDAMKFDGVRWPATAVQMQQIADMIGCMMLTPKVCDLIWQQADMSFDAIVNINGNIVATTPIPLYSDEVDKKIAYLGGCDGIVASVGKYWVLTNKLADWQKLGMKYGVHSCCNYGWHSSAAPYAGVTRGLKVWQSPGYAHNDAHVDPSQTIRLMSRYAALIDEDGNVQDVDLRAVAGKEDLAPMLHHDKGTLRCLRQPSVPEPEPVKDSSGVVTLPETVIYGNPGAEDRDDRIARIRDRIRRNGDA